MTSNCLPDPHLLSGAELQCAMNNGEVYMVYQPIVSLANNRRIGVEALLRWEHPQLGQINPEVTIQVAHRSNMIQQLGWWVIRRAVCEFKQIKKIGDTRELLLSINISPLQLKDLAENVSTLSHYAADHDCDASQIILEITEDISINEQHFFNAIRTLQAHGFRVAIDDFGVGHTTMSMLKNIQAEYIKIDKSLISNIDSCKRSAALYKGVIHLAHKMGAKVIAEGIETSSQLNSLKAVEGFWVKAS